MLLVRLKLNGIFLFRKGVVATAQISQPLINQRRFGPNNKLIHIKLQFRIHLQPFPSKFSRAEAFVITDEYFFSFQGRRNLVLSELSSMIST